MAKKRTIIRKKIAVDPSVKEQRQIEKLLGEEFDSLSQARRALKRESKPLSEKALKAAKSKSQVTRALAAPSKIPTKLPRKKNYAIRELSGTQKRALNDLINDNQGAIQLDDKLLKPGEQWGAIIPHRYTGTDLEIHTGHARTFQLYGRLDQLFKKLTEYAEHGMKLTKKKKEKFLSDIKIVKWNTPADGTLRDKRLAWNSLKKEEVGKRNVRKKAVKKVVSDLNKRNRALERKVAKLEAEKAASKKASKTSKKTTKKGKR